MNAIIQLKAVRTEVRDALTVTVPVIVIVIVALPVIVDVLFSVVIHSNLLTFPFLTHPSHLSEPRSSYDIVGGVVALCHCLPTHDLSHRCIWDEF